jgi:hypothetical protein
MFQELLAQLPKAGGSGALALSVAGAVVGFWLWIAGSRFNRMTMTLVGVGLGGMLGMWMPRWMNWDVNTMATSLSLAMCLGAMGFAMPRAWVGLGLVLILCLWAAIGTWTLYHENARLVLPTGSENLRDYWAALWLGLPEGVKSALPMALGMASLAGLALAVMWKRAATALLYSLIGVTMVLAMGLWAIALRGNNWPQFLPERAPMQWVLVGGMVVLGAMVQWMTMPTKKKVLGESQERRGEYAGAR